MIRKPWETVRSEALGKSKRTNLRSLKSSRKTPENSGNSSKLLERGRGTGHRETFKKGSKHVERNYKMRREKKWSPSKETGGFVSRPVSLHLGPVGVAMPGLVR